jgi:oxygen-independent coproporphyrinogen-3 oxidase
MDRFEGYVEIKGNRLRITESARLIARLVANELDTFKMPDGRHSRAL